MPWLARIELVQPVGIRLINQSINQLTSHVVDSESLASRSIIAEEVDIDGGLAADDSLHVGDVARVAHEHWRGRRRSVIDHQKILGLFDGDFTDLKIEVWY